MGEYIWRTLYRKLIFTSHLSISTQEKTISVIILFLDRFRSSVKIQLFLWEMLLKSYMHGTWLWKGKVIAVGQTYFHEAVYLYDSIRNFHGTSCNWRDTLDIVCPKDFKQNWKYFQKDLCEVKEHTSGVQNIFFFKL